MRHYTVLALAGSLRAASTNKGLVRCALANAPAGLHIITEDLAEVPLYNADVAERGTPEAVRRVLDALRTADALLLACPEYNYSMAPALKNILDWASREPDNVLLNGKPVAIMGAGGGMGTSRAQYHLRQVCVYLNLIPVNKPECFINAFGGDFNKEGDVTGEKTRAQVVKLLEGLQALCERWLGA